MNLQTARDEELIKSTECLIRQERDLLAKILRHLNEIQRRRLYSSLGYKSLFDFAVRHLGYPEDQAYRRIAAMKLLNEMPEIEETIASGGLTLTHLSLAHSFFRQEKKSQQREIAVQQKLDLLKQFAGKSTREAQRLTFAMASTPTAVKPDRIQFVSENQIEVSFCARHEVQDKVQKLKGLLAHKHPNLSLGELFEKLCDLGLDEWNPVKVVRRSSSVRASIRDRKVLQKNVLSTIKKVSTPIMIKSAAPRKLRVYDPAWNLPVHDESILDLRIKSKVKLQPKSQQKSQTAIRRSIFARANGECENCQSTFALEIDHLKPKALGGSSDETNLRVLCRSCNQRSAIKAFGIQKMAKYVGSSQV